MLDLSLADISVIGYGRLGSGITSALISAGIIPNIAVHSTSSRQKALDEGIRESHIFDGIDNLPPSDVYLAAVRDAQIEEADSLFAAHFGEQLKDKFVVHFSASIGAGILRKSQSMGARTAAMHPFQTFFRGRQTNLAGIAWGIDCSPNDEETLSGFVKFLDGTPVILSDFLRQNKPLYHLAAVAASNLLVAPLALAKLFANEAGIDPAVFFPPIIRETVENNLNILQSSDIALTGPITRGDEKVIAAHLKAIEYNPKLGKVYRLMSAATALIAHSQGIITDEIYEKITKLLNIKDLD